MNWDFIGGCIFAYLTVAAAGMLIIIAESKQKGNRCEVCGAEVYMSKLFYNHKYPGSKEEIYRCKKHPFGEIWSMGAER